MARQVLVALMFVSGTVFAQSPAEEAKAALGRFMDAWNRSDVDAVRAEMNFPSLTLFGELSIAESPKEFTVDFQRMVDEEHWARSAFAGLDVIRESDEQVHIVTTYTRFNAKGEPYAGGRMFIIVTNQEGHWGMQFRSPVSDDAGREQHRAEIRGVIDEFFDAWNREDNDGIHQVVRFPHAFLIGGGRVAASTMPSELNTDFAGMRAREGWNRSTYDAMEIAYADELLAFVYLTFHRHDRTGDTYRSVPALWIVTRDASAWRIQVRIISTSGW